MSFCEILEPVADGFDSASMTEEEFAEFAEAEVKRYRAERRELAAKPK
jgi:hypothetical protein